MNAERGIVGWNFWLLWVLANVVGYGLGGAAISPIYVPGEPAEHILPTALLGACLGLAGGFMQWLCLRRHLTRSGWWVLAAASGWTLSAALGAAGTALGGLLPAVGFFGGFVGASSIPQWLILRRQVAHAGWWVPATILGLVIGGGFFDVIDIPVVGTTLFGAGFGAVYGVITGAVLVWLLQGSIPKVAKQSAAAS